VQREPRVALVRVMIEMINALGIKGRCAAFDTVDNVTLAEKELGKVGAILAGRACYHSNSV
jgi:hypothetical protein